MLIFHGYISLPRGYNRRFSMCTDGAHGTRGSQGTATTKTLGQMQCQRRILRPGETTLEIWKSLERAIEIWLVVWNHGIL